MDLLSVVTITAPSTADGFGEIAVLNNSASGNFVGYLWDASGFDGPPVRTSMDLIPGGPGATFGEFQHGPRSFTLEVQLTRSSSYNASNVRRDKLYRAFNAMSADGSIVWTESGASDSRTLYFRREQPPRGPDKEGKVLLAGIAADARMYSSTAVTGTSPSTNSGNAPSPPTFTFTPSGNGTVILTNTTTGLGSPALTLTVGGTSGLSTGSAVTVNFKDKTVTQGGTLKNGAVSFPSSIWWEVIPGANTWTRTGTATISVAAAISFQPTWI